jgi:hypothetical protein
MKIKRENTKQEELLLSVLPRHIATEVQKDFNVVGNDTLFHKIYIVRHENLRHHSGPHTTRASPLTVSYLPTFADLPSLLLNAMPKTLCFFSTNWYKTCMINRNDLSSRDSMHWQ